MHTLEHVREQAQAALAIANKVLEFGPRAPEFTGHIQAGINEFALAAAMIGLAGDDGRTVDEACAACPELADKLSAGGLGDGNKGPFMDLITQLLNNPALMQIILALLKIKLPTAA